MRRAFSYFFLLLIINLVLFHPMNETDWVYSASNDPINSLTELVLEVCLEVPDTQAGDERSGETDQFSGLQVISWCTGCSVLLERTNMAIASAGLSIVCTAIPPRISVAVISPPPELLA